MSSQEDFLYIYISSCRADEVKEHPFFLGVDWQQVYMQKYPPPLIPPRGEVNAADAFDIGSFDEEDTKGYKVRLTVGKTCSHPLPIVNWLGLFSMSAVDGEGSGIVSKFPAGHFGTLASGSGGNSVRHHQPGSGQSRGQEEIQTSEIRSRRKG